MPTATFRKDVALGLPSRTLQEHCKKIALIFYHQIMINFNPTTLPDHFLANPAHRNFFTEDSQFIFTVDNPNELPQRLKIATNSGRNKVKFVCGKSSAKLAVRAQDKSEIYIGHNVSGHWQVAAFRDARITIKDNASSRGLAVINCGFGNSFELGEDAMLAEDVRFNIGDQHAIIDLEAFEPLNQAVASLICGSHVWFGYGSLIMISSREVRIGDGSIVGAGSLVTRSIPNFSLAAGVPARVIKKNVSWTRSMYPNINALKKWVKTIRHEKASDLTQEQ
jgi:acetyltransferase-like isoleucine patch superfamily enzyme